MPHGASKLLIIGYISRRESSWTVEREKPMHHWRLREKFNCRMKDDIELRHGVPRVKQSSLVLYWMKTHFSDFVLCFWKCGRAHCFYDIIAGELHTYQRNVIAINKVFQLQLLFAGLLDDFSSILWIMIEFAMAQKKKSLNLVHNRTDRIAWMYRYRWSMASSHHCCVFYSIPRRFLSRLKWKKKTSRNLQVKFLVIFTKECGRFWMLNFQHSPRSPLPDLHGIAAVASSVS